MILGIDLGGTSLKVGLVDNLGQVTGKFSLKTNRYTSFDSLLDDLYDELSQRTDLSRLEAVGMGCPNGNFYTGCIENAVNLPWKGIIPVARMMEDKFGVICRITNDANAAALGEMTYGTARRMKDFIMLTLGTGVGGGIVAGGRLLYGHDGLAGELGHVIVEPHGRLCGCGRRGCLEAYCSATGVARTAVEMLAESDVDSILRKTEPSQLTSKHVYDAAVSGDRLAKKIFEYTGEILGRAIAGFIAFSSPEAVVLFGGLTRAGDLLMDSVKKSVDDNILDMWKGKVKILFSELSADDAAILGAASVVQQEE